MVTTQNIIGTFLLLIVPTYLLKFDRFEKLKFLTIAIMHILY